MDWSLTNLEETMPDNKHSGSTLALTLISPSLNDEPREGQRVKPLGQKTTAKGWVKGLCRPASRASRLKKLGGGPV